MRIIGGTLGGRVFRPPLKKWPTRPTTDIAREALYNILANRIDLEDMSVLDLFGGTGAHTMECLSRGSGLVTYVDAHHGCVNWVKNQVATLGFKEKTQVIKSDVAKFIKRYDQSYDLIFADPPYALPWLKDIPNLIFAANLLNKDGILVIEHGNNVSLKGNGRFKEDRKYGQSRFSFFE